MAHFLYQNTDDMCPDTSSQSGWMMLKFDEEVMGYSLGKV